MVQEREALSSWPIRRKLILLLLIVFLAASGIVIESGLQRRRYQMETATNSALLLVQSLAAQQEQVASGTRQMLRTLAQFPEVKKLDAEACNELFRELNDQQPFYTLIAAATPDGNMFANSTPFKPGSVNLGDRKHFKDALRTLDFSAGEYILGRVSKVHSINYTFPVQDGKRGLVAIVIAGFRLDEYSHLMKKANLPEGSSLTITDHAGVRLFRIPEHRETSAGKPIPADSIEAVSGGGEQGFFERTGEDGIYRVYAFKQLRLGEGAAPYMYLLVGVPKDIILRKANLDMLRDLSLLGLAAVLATFAAWLVGYYTFVRPISRLVSAARRFGRGEMAARTDLPHTSDELGQLAKSFDDMAQLLQKSYDELEEKVCERTAELALANAQLRSEIEERNRVELALRESENRFKELADLLPQAVFEADAHCKFTFLNQAAFSTFGYTSADLDNGLSCQEFIAPRDREKIDQYRSRTLDGEKTGSIEITAVKKDGSEFPGIVYPCAIYSSGKVAGVRGIFVDLSERKKIERELLRTEKLESIGRLAAGIAHEINTPAQYVWDNTRFLGEAFSGLESIQQLYDELIGALRSDKHVEGLVEKIDAAVDDSDLEYARYEIPKAIEQSLEGIAHISRIVGAMKEFSHPGTGVKTNIDLNRAIESSITVAGHEWKFAAEMVTDFDPDLPLVPCLPGEMNQVILNLVINATDAIKEAREKKGSDELGAITVSTRTSGEFAEIRIGDTGGGIDENIRSRLFDPFFTTKEVGKGTGQGLAVCHSVVVDKHGGTISFESEVGKGTVFLIRLPLQNSAEKR